MLSIDPDRVDQASSLLRAVADTTDDMFGDIQQGVAVSDVWPLEQRTLLEVGEELGLLASTLTYRAELARGHTLGLAGLGASFGAHYAESALLKSLGDIRGFASPMAGDLGLSYIFENFDRFDINGDGTLETDELNALLTDPSVELSAVDRDAIRTLADRFIEWSPVSRNDITRLLNQNDASRLLDPALAELARTRREPMRVDDLHATLVEMRPELADEINALFADDDVLNLYLNGADLVDLDLLLARSINLGAYSHSGTMAAEFVRSLPSGADRKPGIDITFVDDSALAEIFVVAAASQGDILEVIDLVRHLPESTGGVRNSLITWSYGVIEALHQDLYALHHPEFSGMPGFGGNGWTALAASASYSVGPAIRGEESYLGVSITMTMRQSFADGNQDISADAVGTLTEILRMYQYGPPTGERKRAFLAGMPDGQAELRMAASKMFEALEATDRFDAQKLQVESNMLFTLHEQTIVDDDLDFNQLSILTRVGAGVGSAVKNCVLRNPFTPRGEAPGSGCKSQSGGEIMTDTGVVIVKMSDVEQLEIPLREIYVDGDRSDNLLDGYTIEQLDLDLHIIGLPDLEPVGVIEGVRSDPTTWVDDDGNFVPGSDWSVYDERMPQIAGLVMNGATDPAFATSAMYHAEQGPLPGRDVEGLNTEDWADWFRWDS